MIMIKVQYRPLRVEIENCLLAFTKNIGLKLLLADKM